GQTLDRGDGRAVRKDRSYPTAYQVGRKCRQAIVLILRPTILNHNIAALHVADLSKALPECARHGCIAISGCAVQKADHGHRRLPARRERPRHRCTAEQRDEFPPPDHSITSSARASRLSGTVRPSALAVLRLITSSYLVGACTGRSAGFSPLRIRST